MADDERIDITDISNSPAFVALNELLADGTLTAAQVIQKAFEKVTPKCITLNRHAYHTLMSSYMPHRSTSSLFLYSPWVSKEISMHAMAFII
jgi:hypothetical protein